MHVIDLTPFYGFFFVFARYAGFFGWLPGIGDNRVSMRARLLFGLLVSILTFLLIQDDLPKETLDPTQFNIAFIAELLLGLFAAFVLRLLLSALDLAGTLVGFNIGLSNAFAQSAISAQQSGVIPVFISFIGLLMIFTTGMDHQLIMLMLQSFKIFQPGQMADIGNFQGDFSHMLLNYLQASFVLALQIAAPITILGLLMMVGVGIVNRLMPALQVFFILQPLQILLGFALLLLALGVMIRFFVEDVSDKLKYLWN